jgi:hypothetical protein|tara:strand:+ start:1001 stop:1267 length:267 start_codon:yes stop_codon:yes gene_type:complete
MVTEKENDIRIGDLVKWFDYYAEGDIVRDVGHGLVLRVLGRSQPPLPGETVLYLVHRASRYGQEWYARRDIDLLSEGAAKKKALNAVG